MPSSLEIEPKGALAYLSLRGLQGLTSQASSCVGHSSFDCLHLIFHFYSIEVRQGTSLYFLTSLCKLQRALLGDKGAIAIPLAGCAAISDDSRQQCVKYFLVAGPCAVLWRKVGIPR
jgi:hypothetical protein